MCCCQPYTRERTSHAPQTSGKRKSKNEKGLPHEVSPPTQRTVLECIVRTVRPSSTVSFEEPATGTVREQREVVSRGLISDTALVLGETLRSCSTVFPGEPTTGTACEREVISRVLTSNNRPVLQCLGRPCSKRTTSRFGRELERETENEVEKKG